MRQAMGSAASLPRFGALFGLFITLVGFVVIVAGVSKLQSQTNHLGTLTDAQTTTYDQAFTQSLIQPYPTDHHFQFSFIWFIIFGQLFALLLCLIVLFVPAFHTGRGACLTFLAILCTLVIIVVENLTFLHKNAAAVSTVYKKKYIDLAYAGAFLVTLGNVFTILAMGFWEPWRPLINQANSSNYYGTNKNTSTTNIQQGGVATAETRV